MTKAYLKRAEVAELLGVPTSTIKHWEHSVKTIGRYVKQNVGGGRKRYGREAIECFREVQRLIKEKRFSINEIDAYFKQGGLTAVRERREAEVKEIAPTSLNQKMQIQVELEEAIKKLEELKALL